MFSNLYIGMLITCFIMVGMGQYQYSHGRDGSYRDYNYDGAESFNLSRYLQSENIDYKEPHTEDLLYDYDYLATPEAKRKQGSLDHISLNNSLKVQISRKDFTKKPFLKKWI